MSTTHSTERATGPIEVVPNEEAKTVTFVADRNEDSTVPPTEWITVAVEDTVDVSAYR